MQALAVTDDAGAVLSADWLAKAEAVHRQLRPNLVADYCARMTAIFANGGRMAVVVDGEAVLAVAIWRVIENTSEGRRLYVDDLVSDALQRSKGVGKCLLAWLEQKAVSLGCDVLALDSGVQRAGAHRFYFREGMHIPAFCFRKALK